MANVKTADLIAKFQYALDNNWGYILGTWHSNWTQAAQNEKVNFMKRTYGNDWKNNEEAKKNKNYTAAMYGARWIGHYVTDCYGLFYWAFKELGGYMYHGSNTMWNKYCTAQGKLRNGVRTDGQELKPGTAVFVLKNGNDRSHVGLFIGNGTVIEASGTKTGVITSKITDTKWSEWGELKGLIYDGNTEVAPSPSNEINIGSAVVNAEKVALRSAPSTSANILVRVDKGKRVQLLDNDWARVSYQGKTGYMMRKFLTE